jgi:AraC-like DNA-binding protein
MTTPLLLQAIDRFVAITKERTAAGEHGLFTYRATASQHDHHAVMSRVPGDRRLISTDGATSDFKAEFCQLAVNGVQFVHYAYQGRRLTEFTLDSEYLGVHYTTRGERTFSLGNTVIAQARRGDYLFTTNKSPLIRLALSEDFAGLSVYFPIPATQRFSLRSAAKTDERLRHYLEHGLIVAGPSNMWGAHLAYALDYAIESTAAGAPDTATAATPLLDEYLYLLFCHELATQADQRDANQQYTAIPLKLKAAESYVVENALQAPSVEEVAAEAGLSVRNLHALFVKFRGMSPSQFIRERRLMGIRTALRHAKAGTTVAEIATFWGYQNFGNFAAVYKKRFGELPSETLERGTDGTHDGAPSK